MPGTNALGSTIFRPRQHRTVIWMTLLLLIVLTGGFLRFSRLPDKPVWSDESMTRLRISGRDEHDDANPALFTGLPIPPEAFEPFQQATPGSSWIGTVRGLARKEPQHPPLYFLLARFASQLMGAACLACDGCRPCAERWLFRPWCCWAWRYRAIGQSRSWQELWERYHPCGSGLPRTGAPTASGCCC